MRLAISVYMKNTPTSPALRQTALDRRCHRSSDVAILLKSCLRERNRAPVPLPALAFVVDLRAENSWYFGQIMRRGRTLRHPPVTSRLCDFSADSHR